MLKQILTSIGLFTTLTLSAANSGEVKFYDETNDTLKVNSILADATQATAGMSPEARVAYIGRQLLGVPYEAGTLDNTDGEKITVNMEQLDCTTYVETVLALAYTIGEGRSSWRDFVYNLERLRYRSGELRDYGSRLHYASDWVVDNVHRGNFKDATATMAGSEYAVKTIDYMTRNRDKYPALADSLNYNRVRNTELGYRSHRFPYIKSNKLALKEVINELREGDVVLITTKIPGLDVQHMGIVAMVNGVPHLMHASTAAGSVVVDKLPLAEYIRRNRTASGIRVIRLTE